MKEYPKVPRYDHPVVEDDWFGNEVEVLEKYDGSNFRFALYDDWYRKYESISDAEDGDLILGSSSVHRSGSEVDEFQDALEFESRLEYIKDNVDMDKLRDLHERYESPVIFYGENMVRHTLEYDWESIEPLIIFDAYVPAKDPVEDGTYHRYEEKFTGFLNWDTVTGIASDVLNMRTARHVQTGVDMGSLSPDSIGESEYSDSKAEGWVIRNGSKRRRVKVRTPEFKELNRKIWGENVDEDDPGAKRIAYKFATGHRIRKEFKKATNEEGYGITPEMLDYLTMAVVEDVWEEEWEEFHGQVFVPYDIYEYVGDRVEGTLMRPDMFGFPDETEDVADNWDLNTHSLPSPVTPDQPVEYIKSMVSDDVLRENAERIVRDSDKEFGNWLIQPLTDDIKYYIWYDCMDEILRVSNEVDGGLVDDSLYDVTVPFVKGRDSL